MFDALTSSNSFRWAAALVVSFPLLVLVLGEIIVRLRRARWQLAGPLALLRGLILPTLAVWIFLTRVVEMDRSDMLPRLVETLLWVFIIHAALSLLTVVVFAGARADSWQAKFPRLFIDLLRGLLVLIGLAVVLSTVWGFDLGKLVAALGVGSLVIGLALQDPVGNLFSGLMLMFERPISVGDWIKFGDVRGKVYEVNWRAIHVLTRESNLVIVPNGMLAKGSFTNYSRPTVLTAEVVLLHFSCDDPPNKVKRVLREAALRTPGVEAQPAPSVRVAEYGDSSITYKVKLRVKGFEMGREVHDEFQARVWYAARRHGLTMPYPTQTHVVVQKSELDAAVRAPLSAEEVKAFPRFGLAGNDAPGKVVSRGAVKHYGRGEQVVVQGEAVEGVHLILNGLAALTVREESSQVVEIARIGRGEFFGEKSLLSRGISDITVTALEDLELLVFDNEALTVLLEQAPQLARELGSVMEARRKALRTGRGAQANGTGDGGRDAKPH